MINWSNRFARWHASQTCRSNGFPAIRQSGLPGKRDDAQRAGMIPSALLILRKRNSLRYQCSLSSLSSKDNLGCMVEISRDPIRTRISFGRTVARLNEDGANICILTAPNVTALIAHKVRPRQVKVMIALSFQNHS